MFRTIFTTLRALLKSGLCGTHCASDLTPRLKPNQLVSAGERPVCKMYYSLGMAHVEAQRGDKLHYQTKIANQTLLIVSLESPFAGISVATTQKKGEEKLTAVVS